MITNPTLSSKEISVTAAGALTSAYTHAASLLISVTGANVYMREGSVAGAVVVGPADPCDAKILNGTYDFAYKMRAAGPLAFMTAAGTATVHITELAS